MDSYFNQHLKCGGQSLIEATLSIAIVLLLLTSILGVIATLKGELKHDFVELNPPDTPPHESKSSLTNQSVKFDLGLNLETLETLQNAGWQIEGRQKNNLVLLSKDDQKIILTKKLGVQLCLKK